MHVIVQILHILVLFANCSVKVFCFDIVLHIGLHIILHIAFQKMFNLELVLREAQAMLDQSPAVKTSLCRELVSTERTAPAPPF